ncbi:MAG TPA: ATP-binding protein [Tepidisphaeraceae bacterium]|nr:ATP-binding protein [Tepidisphaeraceae bacterium]
MPAVRTHPGITRRILTAFVLLTLLPAVAVSWLGMRAVGQVIEDRLVRERVANAAQLMREMRLPLSQLMMQRLATMFGHDDEVAAELNPDAIGENVVSSLDPAQERAFVAQLQGRATLPPAVRLGGREYVIGAAEVRDPANGQGRTLYLLVDRRVLDDAKAAAVRPILLGAIPVLLAVLLAAFVVSRTITRPIRRLSTQIEAQISPTAAPDAKDAGLRDVDLDAPRELADLATTFNRMLARLRETQARLLDAERLAAVGKIAASVAHEVRNPLAGIRMNLQLLQQQMSKAGTADESLEIAIAELDRLDSIVQEMLILGRRTDPRLEPVDLRECAADVMQLLARRLDHAGVRVTIDGPPAPARADPAQLKQVLLNLVLNAIDAMPQGGALSLRTSVVTDTGSGTSVPLVQHRARIEIDDTGAGLNLVDGQDPFAWFSTSKSAGSGIGLAVCKQIVDAHAGRIGLERLPAGGTRAWVELNGA